MTSAEYRYAVRTTSLASAELNLVGAWYCLPMLTAPAVVATAAPPCRLDEMRPLTLKAPMVEADIPGLNKTLFLHQRVIVQKVLDHMSKRVIKAVGDIPSTSSVIAITEAYGAGKTIIAIAIILLQQSVRAIPAVLSTPPTMYIGQMFTHEHALLMPTLVLVAPQVLDQWADVITESTSLKVYIVRDNASLREFSKLVATRDINAFDVVLVKNGEVTGRGLGIPGETDLTETRQMIVAVASITRELVFRLTILDDFDTNQTPKGAVMVNSVTTILMSATFTYTPQSEDAREHKHVRAEGQSMENYLLSNRPLISECQSDPVLQSLCIRVSKSALRKSKRVPEYVVFRCVLESGDDMFIGLIGAMKDQKEVAELLNGDACRTAAKLLNINASSPADILRMLLDKKYKEYERLTRGIAILRVLVTDVMSVLDNYPLDGNYTHNQVKEICRRVTRMPIPKLAFDEYDRASAALKTAQADATLLAAYNVATNDRINAIVDGILNYKDPPKKKKGGDNTATPGLTASSAMVVDDNDEKKQKKPRETINNLYYTPMIETSLNEFLDSCEARLAAISEDLSNVRDNFRSGVCNVCRRPNDGNSSLFINQCCGAIICTRCGIHSNRFSVGYDYRTGKRGTLHGNCPNCGRSIYPKENMIFIEQSVNMDAIFSGAVIEEDDAPEEMVVTVPDAPIDSIDAIIAAEKSGKVRCLARIARGEEPENVERIDKRLNNMLAGDEYVPPAPGRPTKVLVFAAADESFEKSAELLTKIGINHKRLGGDTHHQAKILREFKTDPNLTVLFITKSACSGMDLSEASAIVYMHSVTDPAVECQIAGRGHRIGRTDSLSIYYLFWTNEANRAQ